jgi:hypothetical protein
VLLFRCEQNLVTIDAVLIARLHGLNILKLLVAEEFAFFFTVHQSLGDPTKQLRQEFAVLLKNTGNLSTNSGAYRGALSNLTCSEIAGHQTSAISNSR